MVFFLDQIFNSAIDPLGTAIITNDTLVRHKVRENVLNRFIK